MEAARRRFIGGNWKSNLTFADAKKLVTDVLNKAEFNTSKVEVVVAPVMIHIPWVLSSLDSKIKVSAQNASKTKMGAFTGEVTAQHLKDFGLEWVIIGHSERRTLYGETDQVVAEKVKICLENKLNVMACVGEKLQEREANQTNNVIKTQLDAIKANVSTADWDHIVIAYEPVWAIGTGKTASPEQAQEVHAFIRDWLKTNVNADVASKVRILYGGSVTAPTAPNLIQKPDIDGFLVGGASLKPEFLEIIKACDK